MDRANSIERFMAIAWLDQKSWYKFLNGNFCYRIASNKVGILPGGSENLQKFLAVNTLTSWRSIEIDRLDRRLTGEVFFHRSTRLLFPIATPPTEKNPYCPFPRQ
jgi:hypothetical protein